MKSTTKYILPFVILLAAAITTKAQTTVNYTLYMRNVSYQTMWDGTVLQIYGFAPNLASAFAPAPTLICNEGDTIDLYTRNISQGNHHTIHPHGMDVPQNMDGVEMTSFSIAHMQDTNYIWVAAHAGTFLYHCHMASIVHVQMGMYGCIVVRAAGGANTAYTGGPAFTREKLWIMAEMDQGWHDTLPQADSLHEDFPVPDYNPNYFLVNGLSRNQLADSTVAMTASVGDKVFLRLANLGYFENRLIFPAHLAATILTSDGRPLPTPIRTDTVSMLSGERYEVMLTPSIETLADVQIQYIDPFTDSIWDTELAPVTIDGVIAIPETMQDDEFLTIYPNPAHDQVFVRLEEDSEGSKMQNLKCKLTDGLGKTVMEFSMNPVQDARPIDISGLSPGIYLFHAENSWNRVVRKLLVH